MNSGIIKIPVLPSDANLTQPIKCIFVITSKISSDPAGSLVNLSPCQADNIYGTQNCTRISCDFSRKVVFQHNCRMESIRTSAELQFSISSYI